jgi:hypothetical protein
MRPHMSVAMPAKGQGVAGGKDVVAGDEASGPADDAGEGSHTNGHQPLLPDLRVDLEKAPNQLHDDSLGTKVMC